jgi:O-antigen/teichoic acid export membrane protein
MLKIAGNVDRIRRKILDDETNRVFAFGAGLSFIFKTIGVLLLLCAQIIAARFLGTEEYGYFAYAQSVLVILSIFTILGYDVSLLRFVPEYGIQQQWAALKGVLTLSFRLSFAAGVALMAIFGGILTFFPAVFSAHQTAVLRIMLLSIPLYSLTMIRQSALRGFKHIVLAELPESIIRPVLFIFALLIISRFYPHLDAGIAWWCYLGVVTITFLVGSYLLVRKMPAPLADVRAEFRRAEWSKISLDMMWMNAMTVIFSQASVVFLGFYGNAVDIALFSAAARIAFFISFALTAANSIAAPMISELFHSGKRLELQRMMTLSAAFIAALTLITNVLLLIGGRQLLGLFGSQFAQAFILLLLLMAGHTFKSFSGPASFLLNMSGHQKTTGKMMAAFLIFHLLVNFLIIPRYGAFGAALATTLTMILWNLALAYASFRFVKVDPTFLSLLKFRRFIKACC